MTLRVGIAASRLDAVWNLDAFIGSVLRDEAPPITGEDGLRALGLMLACDCSSELRAEVEV